MSVHKIKKSDDAISRTQCPIAYIDYIEYYINTPMPKRFPLAAVISIVRSHPAHILYCASRRGPQQFSYQTREEDDNGDCHCPSGVQEKTTRGKRLQRQLEGENDRYRERVTVPLRRRYIIHTARIATQIACSGGKTDNNGTHGEFKGGNGGVERLSETTAKSTSLSLTSQSRRSAYIYVCNRLYNADFGRWRLQCCSFYRRDKQTWCTTFSSRSHAKSRCIAIFV